MLARSVSPLELSLSSLDLLLLLSFILLVRMQRLAERVLTATMSCISIMTHCHIRIIVVPRPVCRRIPWRFLAHEVDYSHDY